MNYNHDNLDLLEIRDKSGLRYIPRGDYADTGTALAPIDTQKIAREWGDEYVSTMNGMLRQYATPTAPTGDRNPQQSGIASPAELASRNERFKWTIVAVVLLATVTALGIVLVAQRAMELDTVGTIAGWLVLSGLGGYASATWVHHRESQLTPESIEMERVKSDYDLGSVDAESRQIIARAFATSIENESETKRANAEAQRAANLSLLERSKPRTAPQRAPVQAYDELDQDDYEQPVQAPFAPTMATYEFAQELEFQAIAPIAPDKDLVAMLAEIDRIYAHCEERDSDIIKIGLEWSAAGDFSPDAKVKAARVLAYFDPPLIHRPSVNGAKYRLNRQWRRPVARAIIAREWGG